MLYLTGKKHYGDQIFIRHVRNKEKNIAVREQNYDLLWLQREMEERRLIDEKQLAFSKLKKVVDRCSSRLGQYIILLENMKVKASLLEKNHKSMAETEAELAYWVVHIYEKFCSAHFCQISSQLSDEKNEECTSMVSSSSVAAFFHEDHFIIQTGRLFSRNMSQYKHKDDHPMYKSVPIFKEEITALLGKNKDKLQGFDQKHITVVSVYHDHSRVMVDNDNLEFKGIIDAIAQFTNGDDALSTSLAVFSLVNPSLQEGTYFIVTKQYGVVLSILEASHILMTNLTVRMKE